MDIFIKLSQFLLSLSLLIILHELGHFIPAKLFKTKVEKFYLFFDVKFSLFKKKIGDTVYGIGWLPLGGYVKIAGMIDESMDKEQMALPPQPWEFRSKPAWQRLIIMLGGVTVNFILAFVIYIGMAFTYGDLYIKNDEVKDGIWVLNPIVNSIGLENGDKIIAVDGAKVEKFHDLNTKILMSKNITVERDGANKEINVPINFIDQLSKSERISIVELRIPFIVSAIQENSKNSNNLQPKDIVVSLNGQKTPYIDQVISQLDSLKGQTVPAVVLRDQKEVAVKIIVSDSAKLGVQYAPRIAANDIKKLGLYEVSEEKYSFFEAIPYGLKKGYNEVISYGKQLKMIFNPETGAYKQVGGFYAIFNIFPSDWSWEFFWSRTAMLSIMLAVMNLLPIPALDGGHVLFLLYEMITGRKPSEKFLERAQMVGFVILISLLLFANGNDLVKAIFGR